MEVCNMVLDLSLPVDTVFNAVNAVADLAEHAGYSLTDIQCVNLAYIVFSRHSVLLQDLREWNRRPLATRTYIAMKQHLRDAQADLLLLPVAGSVSYTHLTLPTILRV